MGMHRDAQLWTRVLESVDEDTGMHGDVQVQIDRGQVEVSDA